jgi:integrase
MFTPSLFEETPVEETYRTAFESWLRDKRATGALQQPASVQVYRDMWDAFMAWCLARVPPLPMSALTLEHLQAFQAARFGRRNTDLSLSPRHALRLVRLVDRVLTHHARRTGTSPNTAAADWIASRPEVRFADAAQGDPLPEFLTVAEARYLIAFVSSARPRPGLSPSRRDSHVAFTWQELRDRTAVALQLGGGLTPGDIRALTLASPIVSNDGARPRRPWPPGPPNCSSTGCRCGSRRGSRAMSCSPPRARGAPGPRRRSTAARWACWRTPDSTAARAARSSCATPSPCGSCAAASIR